MAKTITTSVAAPRQPSPLMILAVVAGIIVVCATLVFTPAFMKAWEKMVRLDCLYNLKQIGLPCREYATNHDGHFPSTWVELDLPGDYNNWANLLRCPSTHHKTGVWAQVDLWADYRLLPGRSTNDAPGTVLAIEPLANHKSTGANVLFVDGSVAWWPASRLLGDASTRPK